MAGAWSPQPRSTCLGLGRAAVSGLSGARRRLGRRRQLAPRPLAERQARFGVARGSLVRGLCRRAGAARQRRSTPRPWLTSWATAIWITALESPRASIAPLARHFGSDAVESEGLIRFQPRDRRPAATLTLEDLVAGSDADAEVMELAPAQETELPQALKWQLVRADEEYDAMSVEACRATGAAIQGDIGDLRPREQRRGTQSGAAAGRCSRSGSAARGRASFRLPPSRLALDPGDVVAARRRRPARRRCG